MPRRDDVHKVLIIGSGGGNCSSDSQCASGFCVDSRCCDTACGGTDKTDCQACSVINGASVDGICSVLPTKYQCRGYADTYCDRKEFCDGVNPTCPPDIGMTISSSSR